MDPLTNASKAGNIDGLYAALRENPNILSIIDEIPFADTPLHIAAVSGHIQYAMEIIRLKPSFARKPNQHGFTPIHVALHKNHTGFVLCLIEKDSELVRVTGREGITPLHYVVQQGNLHLVERFLSVYPEAIEDVTVQNETALHIALKYNRLEIFEVLIDGLREDGNKGDCSWKKMILNCKELEGNTVLHMATIRNQPQALQILLKYKKENPGMLETDAVNNDGKTASNLALIWSYDSTYIQELLREISSKSSQKQTQNQDLAIPVVPESTSPHRKKLDRLRILDWGEYFQFELGKDKRGETRSDLLVIAVLMATATYQAGLSPPGGLREDRPESLLASTNPGLYVTFIFFNSLGFFMSLNTIGLLIYKYPLYWETYVAMMGMIVTYDVTFFAISPPGVAMKIFKIICTAMPILVAIAPLFMRLCFKGLLRKVHT